MNFLDAVKEMTDRKMVRRTAFPRFVLCINMTEGDGHIHEIVDGDVKHPRCWHHTVSWLLATDYEVVEEQEED